MEKIVGAKKERDEAKEKAQLGRITTVAAGNTKARGRKTWLWSKMPWRLRRRLGTRLRLRLPTWRLNELHSY